MRTINLVAFWFLVILQLVVRWNNWWIEHSAHLIHYDNIRSIQLPTSSKTKREPRKKLESLVEQTLHWDSIPFTVRQSKMSYMFKTLVWINHAALIGLIFFDECSQPCKQH